MKTTDPGQSLLVFPCRFPVKAMGRQGEDFQRIVSGIILARARLMEGEALRFTPSKNNNYVSITAVIEAESQQQLDAIYRDLSACEQVLMAL